MNQLENIKECGFPSTSCNERSRIMNSFRNTSSQNLTLFPPHNCRNASFGNGRRSDNSSSKDRIRRAIGCARRGMPASCLTSPLIFFLSNTFPTVINARPKKYRKNTAKAPLIM